MELRGRTAVVTGSGRGIGRALALEFARQGANVVCCARRDNEIRETVALLEKDGGCGLAVAMDVTQKHLVENMVKETLDRFGRIDILFNNAGSFCAAGGIWEVDPGLWWHDITVNLRGPMLCCQAVLPHMMKQNEGIIINMKGGGAAGPFPGGSGYACSKAALMRLTDSLAEELKKVNSSVLVFGMGPGFVRTELTESLAKTPLGQKWIFTKNDSSGGDLGGPPEDCAKAAVELIRIARPELSGRIFATGMNFDEISRRVDEIQEKDLFVIRERS